MEIRNVFYLIIVMLLFGAETAFSQVPRLLTLSEVVAIAQQQSSTARQATTRKNSGKWNYKIFRSRYLPSLNLTGTIPDFSNSISNTLQPDGSQAFRQRTLSNSNSGLNLSQNIGPTGGTISVSSQLQRLDIFDNTHTSSYLAQPLVIGLNQPLFRFNQLRWDNKIEPLKYLETQLQYGEDMENVSFQASTLFFNLLVSQTNYEASAKNKTNTDTLYKISQGRYNLGKIAENELLQLELATMNAQNQISQGELDVQINTQRLLNYLNLPLNQEITLGIPNELPEINVEVNKALEEARKNRKNITSYERMRLEAQRDVRKAKADNYLNANLSANYGLTKSAVLISDVYKQSLPQQQVTLGFSLPIVTWGSTNAQVLTAKANQELTDITIQQQQQNFEQEVILAATQLRLYRQKVIIARKADTIAQKRYEITSNRYLIGKITILDLNTALNDRFQAKLAFINSLNDFWSAWYDLRRKTLYDFERGEVIKY